MFLLNKINNQKRQKKYNSFPLINKPTGVKQKLNKKQSSKVNYQIQKTQKTIGGVFKNFQPLSNKCLHGIGVFRVIKNKINLPICNGILNNLEDNNFNHHFKVNYKLLLLILLIFKKPRILE